MDDHFDTLDNQTTLRGVGFAASIGVVGTSNKGHLSKTQSNGFEHGMSIHMERMPCFVGVIFFKI